MITPTHPTVPMDGHPKALGIGHRKTALKMPVLGHPHGERLVDLESGGCAEKVAQGAAHPDVVALQVADFDAQGAEEVGEFRFLEGADDFQVERMDDSLTLDVDLPGGGFSGLSNPQDLPHLLGCGGEESLVGGGDGFPVLKKQFLREGPRLEEEC